MLRDRGRQLFEEYLARQDEFGPEWAEAAIRDDFGGWLTAEELTDIAEKLRELWMPYIARLAAGEPPRPGTRLVYMSAQAFPRADNLDEPLARDLDGRRRTATTRGWQRCVTCCGTGTSGCC